MNPRKTDQNPPDGDLESDLEAAFDHAVEMVARAATQPTKQESLERLRALARIADALPTAALTALALRIRTRKQN